MLSTHKKPPYCESGLIIIKYSIMVKTPDEHYRILGQISVTESLDAYQKALNQLGSQLFDPQSILVIVFHAQRQPRVIFRSIPNQILRKTFDSIYHRLGYMLDPFYQHAFIGEDQRAYHLREIAPDRFEQSDYFSTYFRTTRMVDELGALYRIDTERTVHLSMGRNEGRPRYRSQEVKLFKAISFALMPKLVQLILNTGSASEANANQLELAERFLQHPIPDGNKLTEREAQIAALIVQGHSSRAIGLKLEISPQTVKVHRRNLYTKLNISAQNELFAILMKPYT